MNNENLTPIVEEVNSENKKRKIRMVDIIAYVICLLLSFGIWAYVVSLENENYEYTFEQVEVQLEGVSGLQNNKGLSIINGYDNKVSITVVGSRREILKYTAEDIFAHVDLDNVNTADRHSLDVMVDLPENIEFVSAQPSKVNVLVDEITSVTVDIGVELLYNVAAELTIHDAQPSVDSIVVTGPKTILNDIVRAKITYDLGSVKTSVNFSSTITLVDSDGNEVVNPYVKTDVSSVEVRVPVTTEKTVPLVAKYAVTDVDKYNYSVTLNPSNIKVSGDPSILSELYVIEVNLGDITEAQDGSVTTANALALPSGVTLVDKTLKTVSYAVNKTQIGK